MQEVHYDKQGREINRQGTSVSSPSSVSPTFIPPVSPVSPSPSPVTPMPSSPMAPNIPATPVAGSSNGLAVAALVLGIISLVSFWAGLVFGILAVIFGFLGRRKARSLGGKYRGLAVAGIVMGFIGVALAMFWIYFMFWGINSALQSSHTQAVSSMGKADANSMMTAVEIYKQSNKGKQLPADLGEILSFSHITNPGTVTYTTNTARDSYCLTVKNNSGAIYFVCKNGQCSDGVSCTP